MKRVLAASIAGVALLLLSACAPAIITPRETVTDLPFEEAFRVAVTTISTQPYPARMGGWVITRADRDTGFVTAEMAYRSCAFVPFAPFTRHMEVRCHTYTARVSVTLIARPDGLTTVGIGASGDQEARELAERIAARLGLFPAWGPL